MNDVSVLIPCHNHGHLLGEAIESALAQTAVARGIPMQVIIVDDGSTDHSLPVAQAWAAREPQRIEVVAQQQAGQATAREAALQRVHCEYLVMLDADDLLEPIMLAEAVAALKHANQAPAVVGQALLVAADGQRVMRAFKQDCFRGWPEILEYNPYGVLAACMVRTSAVRAVGGLNVPGTPGCEDWDLWARFARVGMDIITNPGAWARYRQSACNYSRKSLTMLRAAIELLDRMAKPDLRLRHFPTTNKPLASPELARLKNGRVFHALGMALGVYDHPISDPNLAAILEFLVPGTLDITFCCMLAVWGLGFVRAGYEAEMEPLPTGQASSLKAQMLASTVERFESIKSVLEFNLHQLGYEQASIEELMTKFSEAISPRTGMFGLMDRFRKRRSKPQT